MAAQDRTAAAAVEREGAVPSGVPPLARRVVVTPAMALREEVTDSWRLLLGSLGAASLTAALLLTLASVLG